MKLANVFVSTVFVTAVSLSVAGYSVGRAIEADPDLISKFKDDHYFNINFQSFGDHSYQDVTEESQFSMPKNEIVVKVVNADIEIAATQGDEVIVSSSGQLARDLSSSILVAKFTGDELTLKQPDNDAARDLKVKIKIPEKYIGKISVKSVNGFLGVSGLNARETFIKTVSGEVNLQDMRSARIDVKSVSGNIMIENKILADYQAASVSGNISLTLVKGNDANFKVHSLSGNIKNSFSSKDKASQKIEAATTSGNIDIQ